MRQPNLPQRCVEHDVRQRRQVIREPLHGERAGEVLHQQAKRLRVLEVPERIHLPLLVVARGLQRRCELLAPRVPVAFREQQPRVEQLVQQDRMARQVVGRPRGRRHEVGEPRHQRRMLDQQRQIRAATADGLQQVEQAREHRLRIVAVARGPRRAFEQLRHQRVEPLARLRGQLQIARACLRCAQAHQQCVGIAIPGVGKDRASGRALRILPCDPQRTLRHIVGGIAQNHPELCGDVGARTRARSRSNVATSGASIASASSARSDGSSGSDCVCWSSRYCSRCSTSRRTR